MVLKIKIFAIIFRKLSNFKFFFLIKKIDKFDQKKDRKIREEGLGEALERECGMADVDLYIKYIIIFK